MSDENKGLWWAVGVLLTFIGGLAIAFLAHVQLGYHAGAETMAQKMIAAQVEQLRRDEQARLLRMQSTQTESLERLARIEITVETVQDQLSQVIVALTRQAGE